MRCSGRGHQTVLKSKSEIVFRIMMFLPDWMGMIPSEASRWLGTGATSSRDGVFS